MDDWNCSWWAAITFLTTSGRRNRMVSGAALGLVWAGLAWPASRWEIMRMDGLNYLRLILRVEVRGIAGRKRPADHLEIGTKWERPAGSRRSRQPEIPMDGSNYS